MAGIDLSRVDFRSVDPSVRNTVFAAGQLELITAFILNLADVEKLAYEQNPGRKIATMRYADYGLEHVRQRLHHLRQDDRRAAPGSRGVRRGRGEGPARHYQDIPAAVATVQRMAPDANVNTEVATRQLELIRDLVITDTSRTNGIGTFQEAQLTATKNVMMRYLGMRTGPGADRHRGHPSSRRPRPVMP